jgi:twitching motility protein PilT
MENTAQNNGINITYPSFNDGSTPQPNPTQPSDSQNQQQQQDQPTPSKDVGIGDFQGKIDTHPTNSVHDSLNDIMPEAKKPKAMEREPKENNLAEPINKKRNRDEDFLVPQDNGINLNQSDEAQKEPSQPQPEEEKKPEVVDLGNTPLPKNEENDVDITMPEIPKPKEQNQDTQEVERKESNSNNTSAPTDDVLSQVADKNNGQFHNQEVNATIDSRNKIDDLLEYTIEKGASDLHISVGYPPVIRIDGDLEEVNDHIIDPIESEELILPLMSDDKRELLEVNKEIDFAYTYEGKYNGRFRINAFYAMTHLSASFRLIPNRIRTIDELKLPQIYHQFTKLRQGMILVTGPTGHGKSTTIAAMLEDINRNRFSRIITIEDPVEYVFQGKKALIDQREMGQDTHSWPIALKSAMRQDPDIILVGEMRDYETIASAITLAETGHLVFATLHTNNSSQSIDRMIDVFPEEQQAQVRAQLSNILEVVIAQRLIPLEVGGRRAVAEILLINPAVQTLIREAKTHQVDNVIRTSSDIGMISLERSLVDLVREGAISIKTAQEFAVYPEEVSRLLKS